MAAELHTDADERLTEALEQLVIWGNLRADADTGRVSSVADFYRKRSLYQLTSAGQAAEQAIASAIDFSDGDVDGFLACKERLIDTSTGSSRTWRTRGADRAAARRPGSRWPRAAAQARRTARSGRRGTRRPGCRRPRRGGEAGARCLAEPVARAG